MLRVGLTGGLGSGKSTVARLLAAHGARVLSSDEIGRELMTGTTGTVRDAIAARFGPEVVRPDGSLDRGALARVAFEGGRLEELNDIVHPAVISRQEQLIDEIAKHDPGAVVVVESALIFETRHGGEQGWRRRFDCVLLVTAPEDVRVERHIQRVSGMEGDRQAREQDARRRMSYQIPDEQKLPCSDYVLTNDGSLQHVREQVDALWPVLHERAKSHP